ncbi:MAG TPA: serine hydrolase, partial [Candidatus Saccharimonas sp.]|nr:serine hydrolase [Candidatus Saccharimonas sp.]
MTRVMDGVGRSSSVRSSSPVVARERTARPASAAAQEAQRQAAVMRLNGLGLDGMRPQLAGAATMAMPAMAASPVLPMLPALPSLPAVSRDRPAWLTKRPVLAYGLVGMAIIAAVTTSFLINRQAGVTAQADNAAGALKFPSPSASPTPAAAAQPETSQAAQDILNAFAAAHPGMYGLYVKDLSTGQVASVAADRQMTSASLYKLFVAKQIYQLIDRGQLSYSSPAGGGSGKTVDGCLTVMINVSDNTCGRALGTIVGWNKQNAALADEGFTGTSLTTPQQTSAQDVGLLLERI